MDNITYLTHIIKELQQINKLLENRVNELENIVLLNKNTNQTEPYTLLEKKILLENNQQISSYTKKITKHNSKIQSYLNRITPQIKNTDTDTNSDIISKQLEKYENENYKEIYQCCEYDEDLMDYKQLNKNINEKEK